MVDGLILMMFLLFRTFRKTLHVATNTEETILDILNERVNKILLLLCAMKHRKSGIIKYLHIPVFHKRTKLAILALLSTLYSHIFPIFSLFAPNGVS